MAKSYIFLFSLHQQLMKVVVQHFLLILALLNPQFKLHQNLLFVWNALVIVSVQFLRSRQYYRVQHLEKVCEIVLNMGVWTQLALDSSIPQMGALLIIQCDQTATIKFMVAISVSLNSWIQPQSYQYYLVLPFMTLLFCTHFIHQAPKPSAQAKPQDLEVRRLSVQVEEEQKPYIEKDKQESDYRNSNSNQIIAEINSNEEDEFLQHMAWTHNLPVLVYNQQHQIIYQNFYLGKLHKKNQKVTNPDFDQVFLDTQVEIGSREVNEMFGFSEDDELQSESFILNGTAHSRYKIQGGNRVRDMLTQLFQNYEKWKLFTFTLYRLKHALMDYSSVYVKVLVNDIKGKLYTLFTFEVIYQPHVKRVLDEPNQFQNIFQAFLFESNSYINSIHMFLLLCLHEVEKGGARVPRDYLKQMRMSTLKFMVFLASMKDLTHLLSNQLIFKNKQFKIADVVEELLIIYEDSMRIKETSILTSIEADQQVSSDVDRVKQVLKSLFDIALKFSVGSPIKLEVRTISNSGLIIGLKDIPLKEESQRFAIQNLLKSTVQLMKSGCKDFDICPNLELQVAAMLAFQLSGQMRRGLEVQFDIHHSANFQYFVESSNSKQISVCQPKKKAFETSLSMLLAQAQDSSQYRGDDSKFLSMTQFSKQYSINKADAILDMQSAHFSQISKVKPESPALKAISQSNSGTNRQGNAQDSVNLNFLNTRAYKDSIANDSSNKPASSALDFGENSNLNINLPELSYKFLGSVIKYKVTNQCCSKVLIVDNDYFTVQILQILLAKFDVRSDKCFTGSQAINMIVAKQEKPCRCKNNSYLLLFIDTHLPEMSCIDLTKEIKTMFKLGSIDKGFLIAMTSLSDVELKLKCFQSGIDYLLCKPFDLCELTAILQYIQF